MNYFALVVKKIIAVSVVVFLYSIFYILNSHPASAAVLFIDPPSQTLAVGGTLVTDVVVATDGETVNAALLELSYPPQVLKFREAQYGGSVFPLVPQTPEVEGGSLRLEAGVPGGFNGQGSIVKLVWEVVSEGSATLSFGEATQLLRHSATPEPVSLRTGSATYQVVAAQGDLPRVASEDHPDETSWYRTPFIRMSWEAKPGASYSYSLSRLASDVPDVTPDEPIGDIKFTPDGDGVFYFHLRECQAGSCGPTVTRRVQTDNTPPATFAVLAGSDPELYNGRTFISFITTDAPSGVARYEVQESLGGAAGTWVEATSPYVLADQGRQGDVLVRAVDYAGNEQVARLPALEATGAGLRPWVIAILVGAVLLLVAIYVYRSRSSQSL